MSAAGGAGIDNNAGTMTLRDSVVTANVNTAGSAGANGGGIVNRSLTPASPGTMTITDSTVSGNLAPNGNGAGIYNANNSSLTVLRSTVSGNVSQGNSGCVGGGGIANAASLVVRNSTVSGNTARAAGGILGCSAAASSTSIVNNTIASNRDLNGAESVANLDVRADADDTATLRSTIVSDPRGGGPNCDADGAATLTSQGFNLASDATCNLTATTDHPSTNPMLVPLAASGGPTRTMALPLTSPAVDQGIGNGLTTDQRGSPAPSTSSRSPTRPAATAPTSGRSKSRRPHPSRPRTSSASARSRRTRRRGPRS